MMDISVNITDVNKLNKTEEFKNGKIYDYTHTDSNRTV